MDGAAAMPERSAAADARLVKAKARELGFDLCGIARAHPLDSARLDRWFEQGWDAPPIPTVGARRARGPDPKEWGSGGRTGTALAGAYAPGRPEPGPAGGRRV